MKKFLLYSIISLPMVVSAYSGEALRSFEKQLAYEAYSICGDTWCEGDFNFTNFDVDCHAQAGQSVCTTSFDMVEHGRTLPLRASCSISKLPSFDTFRAADFYSEYMHSPLTDCIQQQQDHAFNTLATLRRDARCLPGYGVCDRPFNIKNWNVACTKEDSTCRFSFDLWHTTGSVPLSTADTNGWVQYEQTYTGTLGLNIHAQCTLNEAFMPDPLDYNIAMAELTACIREAEESSLKTLRIASYDPEKMEDMYIQQFLQNQRSLFDVAVRTAQYLQPDDDNEAPEDDGKSASYGAWFTRKLAQLAAADCANSWCGMTDPRDYTLSWDVKDWEFDLGRSDVLAEFKLIRYAPSILTNHDARAPIRAKVGFVFVSHYCAVLEDSLALPLVTKGGLTPQEFYSEHLRPLLDVCVKEAIRLSGISLWNPITRQRQGS